MNQQPSSPRTTNAEITIDLGALFKKLLQHRKYIFIVTLLSGVLGCVVALTSARKYTVQVTLAPEVSGNSRAGTSLKSLTSLLGVGNLSLNTSNDALNITLFPEICSSTAFLSGLFDVQVTPYVSSKDLADGAQPPQPIRLYDFMLGKHRPKSAFAQWKEEFFKKEDPELAADTISDGSYFNKEQTRIIKAMRMCIGASVDKKTGVTNLKVVMPDPRVAQQVADTVCQRLQDFVTNYRIKKTHQDYLHYQALAREAEQDMKAAQDRYAASVDYDRSVILQTVTLEKPRLEQEAQMTLELYMQMKKQE